MLGVGSYQLVVGNGHFFNISGWGFSHAEVQDEDLVLF